MDVGWNHIYIDVLMSAFNNDVYSTSPCTIKHFESNVYQVRFHRALRSERLYRILKQSGIPLEIGIYLRKWFKNSHFDPSDADV